MNLALNEILNVHNRQFGLTVSQLDNHAEVEVDCLSNQCSIMSGFLDLYTLMYKPETSQQ